MQKPTGAESPTSNQAVDKAIAEAKQAFNNNPKNRASQATPEADAMQGVTNQFPELGSLSQAGKKFFDYISAITHKPSLSFPPNHHGLDPNH